MKPISKLHFITTNAAAAEDACKGGVDWVQLRLKNIPYADYYEEAYKVKMVCKKYNATFIVNDNVALALDINADGVHLGRKDMQPEIARSLIGSGFIIGSTANTAEDIMELAGKPINYIGLGPYRFTDTKQNLSPVLGLSGYRRLFSQLESKGITHVPVIGIGGITTDDVSVLMSTGLHGIAVSGAIAKAADVTDAAKKFRDYLNPENKSVQKTVFINAPARKVWESITTPALIREWLSDTPIEVESKWEEGGEMIFRGKWHSRSYEDKGTILSYLPGQTLKYTFWSHLSQLPDVPENYSVIEFSLKPLENGTELTLTQSNFILDTIYRHSNYYWTLTLDRLKKSIENK